MKEMKKELEKYLNKKFPFVIYRKPNSERINVLIQRDNSINYIKDYTESGFVFAPFDNEKKSLIIPFNISTKKVFINNFDIDKVGTKEIHSLDKKAKKSYISLLKRTIHHINSTKTKKIVVSRKELLEIENIDIFEVLIKLLFYYSNAFVYLWYHPLTGVWMGATPEVLLKVKNNKFKTMALAATKSYKGSLDVNWDLKERLEQQLVTDFIKNKLLDLNLKIDEPVTIKAGSLVHICSAIEGDLIPGYELSNLIDILHPTPAVCGIPKKISKRFILENENYDREFYTGFLGEMNTDSTTNLFVNLRCMKIDTEAKKISLFIGGGITRDSIPDDEWNETIIKSGVMKRVL